MRIEFAKSSQADHAALMPGLRREGTRVSFQAEEMLSAYNTFRAAVELAGWSASPGVDAGCGVVELGVIVYPNG